MMLSLWNILEHPKIDGFHTVFCQAKKQFETSLETSELAGSTESHQILDVLVISDRIKVVTYFYLPT